MNVFLPLNGAFLVIELAMLVVKVYAVVDSLMHPDAAYRAADKLSKVAWVTILVVAVLFSASGFLAVIGLIAALVYLLDVRPAVRGISGGSSSSGPYGPW
jgi:hypothetical protein